jgi:hypothetical protein
MTGKYRFTFVDDSGDKVPQFSECLIGFGDLC